MTSVHLMLKDPRKRVKDASQVKKPQEKKVKSCQVAATWLLAE